MDDNKGNQTMAEPRFPTVREEKEKVIHRMQWGSSVNHVEEKVLPESAEELNVLDPEIASQDETQSDGFELQEEKEEDVERDGGILSSTSSTSSTDAMSISISSETMKEEEEGTTTKKTTTATTTKQQTSRKRQNPLFVGEVEEDIPLDDPYFNHDGNVQSFMDEYNALHNKLMDSHSKRVVVYLPMKETGLGNSLLALSSAFFYAILTKRAFLLNYGVFTKHFTFPFKDHNSTYTCR